MRLISLVCFFIVSSAHSVDIALPIKAKNPDCQIELTAREDFWSTTHKRMMLDLEITLALQPLNVSAEELQQINDAFEAASLK